MSFKKLIELRAKQGLDTEHMKRSAQGIAARMKEYEREQAEQRKQLEPTDKFYNKRYDI